MEAHARFRLIRVVVFKADAARNRDYSPRNAAIFTHDLGAAFRQRPTNIAGSESRC